MPHFSQEGIPVIGASVLRKEGRAKVMGRARYVADKDLRHQLYGVTVRSSVASGVLRAIRLEEGFPWKECVVVGAADIPGENRVAHLAADQPFLVELGGRVRHPEEPVLLLAHADRELLEEARRRVHLEIDPLPAVPDLDAALARHDAEGEGLFKEIRIAKGDVEAAWGGAAHVLEGTYRTEAQEHLYLEPQGMTARVAEGDHRLDITVCGSMQCPYYVHHALTRLFGVTPGEVRVMQMETGGAFGGKEDYPSMLAGHAALLAWKAKAPVRMIYDRREDMVATTKRHPSRIRLRSAFDAAGRLLALDVDLALDAGAYTTLSPVVLSRAALHACGVYRCPNVRIRARALATNRPPMGAFRGFGAPQSLFAIERHMDRAALAMGLPPEELRRRNFLRIGDTTATGQVLREEPGLEELLDRALTELDYGRKRQELEAANALSPRVRRGVGFSVFLHGCGFTGSGEARLASVAGVEGSAEGRVTVLAASTEMGQGKDTVFSQIVAEALRIPVELVEVAQADTRVVPDSGPTVASRSTMVVGRLLEQAALALKQALLQEGLLHEPYDGARFSEALRQYHARHGALKCYSQYASPPHIRWDEALHAGDAYPAFSWGCCAVALRVDLDTYETRVEDVVSVQEVGRVINPTLAEGQVEGGVAQGLGLALMEQVQWRDGRMANVSFSDYAMPGPLDLPRTRVLFLERPHPLGPGGAKGLGELPMDGPMPAVLNALQHALGPEPRLDEVPMTPERLLDRLEEVGRA